MFPEYHLPRRFILGLLRDWLLLRPRRFRADAQACIGTLGPHLKIFGVENIPSSGAFIVTFNHYHRPGFDVWWLTMAIAAALPLDAHVIMTGELTRWYPPLGGAFSRFALPRLARVYGFTSMPPMPPRPRDVAARAKAVRQILAYVEKTENPVLLIAPEGRDNLAGGVLDWPPPGVGRFLSLITAQGLVLVPVGGWEQEGALCVRFGPGVDLSIPHGLSADEKDRAVSQTVMKAIADLLPQHLRGDFS